MVLLVVSLIHLPYSSRITCNVCGEFQRVARRSKASGIRWGVCKVAWTTHIVSWLSAMPLQLLCRIAWSAASLRQRGRHGKVRSLFGAAAATALQLGQQGGASCMLQACSMHRYLLSGGWRQSLVGAQHQRVVLCKGGRRLPPLLCLSAVSCSLQTILQAASVAAFDKSCSASRTAWGV